MMKELMQNSKAAAAANNIHTHPPKGGGVIFAACSTREERRSYGKDASAPVTLPHEPATGGRVGGWGSDRPHRNNLHPHPSSSGICWERPTHFHEGKSRAALDEFGGSLTRENEKEVAAKMAVTTRTLWRWWKSLSTK